MLADPEGLFTVASLSYLILITKREQVAQIYGRPIYVISGVAIVPLSSQSEAKLAVESTRRNLTRGADHLESDVSDNESENDNHGTELGEHEVDPVTPSNENRDNPSHVKPTESIAQDVISKKGAYGMFAARWFSKKGWSAERQKSQGMSSSSDLGEITSSKVEHPSVSVSTENGQESNEQQPLQNPASDGETTSKTSSVAIALLPKLLRTTRLMLHSRSFYFSYDDDITRRLGTTSSKTSQVPLHKQVDPQVRGICSVRSLAHKIVSLESISVAEFC